MCPVAVTREALLVGILEVADLDVRDLPGAVVVGHDVANLGPPPAVLAGDTLWMPCAGESAHSPTPAVSSFGPVSARWRSRSTFGSGSRSGGGGGSGCSALASAIASRA